jgi:hypothetical protein
MRFLRVCNQTMWGLPQSFDFMVFRAKSGQMCLSLDFSQTICAGICNKFVTDCET